MERAVERVQDEPKDLERDSSEQRLIPFLTEDDGRGRVTKLSQVDVTLAHVPLDERAVSEGERLGTQAGQIKRLPDSLGRERVDRPAVDEEADVGLTAGGSAQSAVDEGDAHAASLPETTWFLHGG